MKLLYFYTKKPGPCALQNLILENLEKSMGDDIEIKRIEAETNKDMIKKYGIREIPSIIAEKDGKEVLRFSGLTQELFLKRAIEKNLI